MAMGYDNLSDSAISGLNTSSAFSSSLISIKTESNSPIESAGDSAASINCSDSSFNKTEINYSMLANCSSTSFTNNISLMNSLSSTKSEYFDHFNKSMNQSVDMNSISLPNDEGKENFFNSSINGKYFFRFTCLSKRN